MAQRRVAQRGRRGAQGMPRGGAAAAQPEHLPEDGDEHIRHVLHQMALMAHVAGVDVLREE